MFVDGAPVLALADGAVLIGEPEDQKRVIVHPDAAILTAISDGKILLTGGDDGRVVAMQAGGAPQEIADEKGRWIDALAMRGKAYAWSAGKQVRARDEIGIVKTWTAPSTARGLAFQPKGYRLAATHYNGATLWFPKVEGLPQTLEWKGAHLDVAFSPDGRFLVTSMQENALHGWRLANSRNMRMTGYPAKTRSLSWSHDGQWLATSGADAAVVWPFKDKDGPMGKAPRECGVRQARVTRVAFHPQGARCRHRLRRRGAPVVPSGRRSRNSGARSRRRPGKRAELGRHGRAPALWPGKRRGRAPDLAGVIRLLSFRLVELRRAASRHVLLRLPLRACQQRPKGRILPARATPGTP